MAGESTPASKFAIEIARHWNEDLSSHRAQMLELETAQSANWIAAMNDSHHFALQQYFGVHPNKIILLGRFDPQNGDDEILDPFGGSRESYETCAIRIQRAVGNLARAIQNREI